MQLRKRISSIKVNFIKKYNKITTFGLIFAEMRMRRRKYHDHVNTLNIFCTF